MFLKLPLEIKVLVTYLASIVNVRLKVGGWCDSVYLNIQTKV